ncbi:MAG: OadG family protein [Saccharofermentanales bacterium]
MFISLFASAYAAAASADRPDDPSILLIAIIGFAAVFVVLMLFWLIIALMQKTANQAGKHQKPEQAETFISSSRKETSKEDISPETVSHAQGECDLHDVDDQTAAFLMAIVADKMQVPLNELYFKSIRSLETKQK